jgi:hypothetical protein
MALALCGMAAAFLIWGRRTKPVGKGEEINGRE